MKTDKRTEMWIFFVMLVAVDFVLPTYSEKNQTSEPNNKVYSERFAPEERDDTDVQESFSPVTMSCGAHKNRRNRLDDNCGGSIDKSTCNEMKGCELRSTLARYVYFQCCPEAECFFFTQPCPRDKWDNQVVHATRVNCYGKGDGHIWHYWKGGFEPDTLYDTQINHMVDELNREKTEVTGLKNRFHTCVKAAPVLNLRVDAYGLGWIYFKWRRPPDNCYCRIRYAEQYTVETSNETFSQAHLGDFTDDGSSFSFKKFHPCAQYPTWFCFIVSENVIPFRNITYQVQYSRFSASDDIDMSAWVNITTRTDDAKQTIKFCPQENFFVSMLFLIILIVLFLLLLIVAVTMIALLLARKRKEERRRDMADEPYEEEPIGPTNILEKIWERLRNFFDQLCPRPKKPPPPPPPPPPAPPKKPKAKPRPPPPKPKPKPKPKTPSPSPPPPPPKPPPKPTPRAKPPSPSPPPPPPPPPPKPSPPPSPPPAPPPPPPQKKPRRGPRTEGKRGPQAAKMDTRRGLSSLGGVRARKRRM